MASTVQTSGGSGVDLSELTSGERFLIGIVGQTVNTGFLSGYSNVLILPLTDLDMSNISSITMTYDAFDTSTSVQAFGAYLGPTERTKTFTPVNGKIEVKAGNFSNYNSGCNVTITSFTTTDGKVHTASNLNY